MDPVFQQAFDEVMNDGLRAKASEDTKGSHPSGDTLPQNQPVNQPFATEATPVAQEARTTWLQDLAEGRYDPKAALEGDGVRYLPGAHVATEEDRKAAAQDPSGALASEALLLAPAKAVIETNDFLRELANDPNTPDKQGTLRKAIDQEWERITSESTPAAVVGGIAQFVSGMVGFGKLLGPLKAGKEAWKARAGFAAAESALAAGVTLDPHQERLSNLIQEYPALENPVTAYLAASPDDGALEGRMKSSLEALGMDAALAGAFLTSLKVIKMARGGDTEGAKALAAQLGDDSSMEGILAQLDEMGTVQGPQVDTGVRMTGNKQRVRVPAGKKPKVRVQAGSSMTGTEANAGKLADDTAQPQATIEQNLDATRSDPQKTLIPEVVTDQDAADILRGTEFDVLRMEQTYWDRTDAMIQSNNALAPVEKLPWKKLRTPDDVSLLIARMADQMSPELDAMKGGDVLKDTKWRTSVRNMARFFNNDPDLWMANLAKMGEDSNKWIATMNSAYHASVGISNDIWKVVQDVRLGNYAPYGGTKEGAITAMRERADVFLAIFGQAESMKSNMARGLRTMRFAVDPKVVASMKSISDEDFMKAMLTTGGDPKKIAELGNAGFWKRVMEEAQFSQRNGLLWFYPTHIVNVTGNVLMQIARPTERALGGAVASLWNGTAKGVRDAAMKEYGYAVTSLFDGMKAALGAALKGDSKLAPHASEAFGDVFDMTTQHPDLGNLTWAPMDSFGGMAANAHKAYNIAFGLPTRALGAQDEFFKMVSYRSTVQSKAFVDGRARGLYGKQLSDYVEDRLKASFDAEGRAIDAEALYEAQTRTFNQELLPGTLGFGIRNLRASFPALGFILPFVKTPINVLRYAHKYTPVLNIAQKEYRQMLSGKLGVERQSQAIGQMMLGSMFTGVAAYAATQGLVTGGGPRDPVLRAQLIQDGWKPYSVRVVEDGVTTFIPYGRLDPIGLPMGIAADLWEVYNADPDNEELQNAATATAISLAKGFSERTFILNVNMFMDAMADPEANMDKFLGGTLRSMVPGGSALKGYVNQDPYLRDARSLMDRMLQDVPGYSERIPPKRHAVLGYPLMKRLGLTSRQERSGVEDELDRIILETDNGIYPPQPVRDGVDLREVRLPNNRTAYDVLQQYAGNDDGEMGPAKPLRKALEDLMASKAYQDMEDGGPGIAATKLNAISGIVQTYRELAYKKVLAEYPEVKQQVLMNKQKGRIKYLENTGNKGAAQNIMDAIGVPKQ